MIGRAAARRPGARITTLPVRRWLRCEGCGRSFKRYGMVRLLRPDGAYVPHCFACYEGRTAGVWRIGDQYWDGDRWVAVERDW